MTDQQAQTIWKLLLAAYPNQVLEAPTQALYLAHLQALPWRDGRTEADVRALIATRIEAFIPALGAMVGAVGIHDVTHRDGTNAARQLAEAVRTGRELVSDLSTASGWAIGAAVRAVPSVADDERLARDGRMLPAPRPEAAFTEEQRRANLARLGSLARTLGAPRPPPPPARPPRLPRPSPDSAVIEAELEAFEARRRALERSDR